MAIPRILQPIVPIHAVDKSLIGGGEPSSVVLELSVEPQAADYWCWAAVAVSIARHYDNSSTLTQCTLATRMLDVRVDCCAAGERSSKKTCDKRFALHTTLQDVGVLTDFDQKNSGHDGSAEFETIAEEINNGRPVAVRVEWLNDGMGHFLVIKGWSQGQVGTRYFHLSDPTPANGPLIIEATEFAQLYNTGAKWNVIYFTQADASLLGGSLASERVARLDHDQSLLGG